MTTPLWGLALGFLPSLVMAAVWALGAVLAGRGPRDRRWQVLAMVGFGVLAFRALISPLPAMLIWFAGAGGSMSSRYVMLLTVHSILQILLEIVGAGLLVAAVASAARQRGASDSSDGAGRAPEVGSVPDSTNLGSRTGPETAPGA